MRLKKFHLLVLILVFSWQELDGYLIEDPLTSEKSSQWMADSKSILESNLHGSQIPIEDLEKLEFERMPVAGEHALRQDQEYHDSSCELVQVVHLLYQKGCQPKAIASFACSGSCPSYVQAHGVGGIQPERSCSCCRQTAIQEAVFSLDCPSLNPPYRKVKTYAPIDCMCRSCTNVAKENLQPYELTEALAGEYGKPL